MDRRKLLAVSSLFALSGCPDLDGREDDTDTSPTEPEPDQSAERTGTSTYFNSEGELTAPLRINDGSFVEYVDQDTGNRLLVHEPSGIVWEWRPDGTLVSSSIQAEDVVNANLNPARPLWSKRDRSIVVEPTGEGDTTSITRALASIPLFVFHDLEIDIRPGDYSQEGTHIVPPTVGSQMSPDGEESHTLRIIGDTSTPSTTKTGPFVVDSFQGTVALMGVEVRRPTTEVNENSAFVALDTPKARFGYSRITGGTYSRTVQAYGGSQVEPHGLDFDGDHAVLISCKQGGAIKHIGSEPDSDIRLGGTLSDNVLRVDVGGSWIDIEHDLSAVRNRRFGVDIYPLGGPIRYDNTVYRRYGVVDGSFSAELSSGTDQRLETGIAASTTTRSRLVSISYKRLGSARIDTAVLLVNDSGNVGEDESAEVFRTDNAGGLESVRATVDDRSKELILHVDTSSNGLLTLNTL